MKATIQQEDLQLLGSTLQERLVAQLPDSLDFQVKCAIKNDKLMILTQHADRVIVDTHQIFEVLEQALQWLNYQTQQVQFFLRIYGEKRPYAQHFLDFTISTIDTENETEYTTLSRGRETAEVGNKGYTAFVSSDLQQPSSFTETEEEPTIDSFPSGSFSDYLLPNSDLSLDNNKPQESEEIEEKFDLFAGIPDQPKKRQFSLSFLPLPVIVGASVVIALLSGTGAFILHRGCIISECKELQTAEQFKNEYQQYIKATESEKDLLVTQQKLDGVITDLQKIPHWSPRYSESQSLVNNFSQYLTKINQVLKALQMVSSSQKTSQALPKNLDELRNRQKLLLEAITSLETVKPDHDLYELVQRNLPNYQSSLKSINRQLLQEQAWLQKIANAKVSAEAAIKRQTTAKSASEWQRIEFDLQIVINTLKFIPIGSLGNEDARKLLAEYQPKLIEARNRTKKEQLSARLYQQAIKSASQAKIYGNQSQWKEAVKSWEQAIQSAKQVGQDTSYFNEAKPLIDNYTAFLKEAEEQFQIYGDLNQVRYQLNKTCTNTIKICTFTIESQKINVRLTPQYDRLFQANNPQVQNHFQQLQEALKVISENARLPLFIYNSQGQERYMKQPQ